MDSGTSFHKGATLTKKEEWWERVLTYNIRDKQTTGIYMTYSRGRMRSRQSKEWLSSRSKFVDTCRVCENSALWTVRVAVVGREELWSGVASVWWRFWQLQTADSNIVEYCTKLHYLVLLGKANLVTILSRPDLLAGAENRPPFRMAKTWPKHHWLLYRQTILLACQA